MKRLLVVIVALWSLGVGSAAGQSFRNELEKFGSFYYYLNSLYVDQLDNPALIEEAIRSTLATLDPHSAYLSPEEVKADMAMMEGSFGGIGVSYSPVRDSLCVMDVVPDSPADKAGIRRGDRVVAIDGVPTKGVSRDSLSAKVRGKVGTSLTLSVVKRGGEQEELKLTRGEIPISTVDAAYTLYNIGYIKVNRFAENTMSDLRKAYKELGNISGGLILDLRGNGGGLLTQGIDMAGFFLPKKCLVASTRGRTEKTYNHYSKGKGTYTTGPLVVLIDEGSASASELVSGALQDYDRAVIVGRQSFGKGLVQKQVVMDDGSALRITTSHYYTPSGRCIQRPFEKGKSAEYYFDHAKRMTDRYYRDSLAVVAPKFKTLNAGRTVLGGGGITPDVYVDIDTTKNYTFANLLNQKMVVSDVAGEYTIDNLDDLTSNYPTLEAFVESWTTPAEVVEECIKRGVADGVEPAEESMEDSRWLLGHYIKATIALNLWGTEGYVRVANTHFEDSFEEAMNILLNPERYREMLGN